MALSGNLYGLSGCIFLVDLARRRVRRLQWGHLGYELKTWPLPEVVIISYIITSIAWVCNGKGQVGEAHRPEDVDEDYEFCNDYLEKIEEHADEENERNFYVDTAIVAVDEFWSKAEDKVWEMSNRRVPMDSKLLLLDAIQESYNKLKYKLREDIRRQGIDLEDRFEPLLADRNTKLVELQFLLEHSESRQDISKEKQLQSGGEAFANQIESLAQVLSADMRTKLPASSMTDMIPVLRDVQREVSEMLQYLEGCRPNVDPQLLKDLYSEYQSESHRH